MCVCVNTHEEIYSTHSASPSCGHLTRSSRWTCGCTVGKELVFVIAKLLSSYEARILFSEYISNARRIIIFCNLLESKSCNYEEECFAIRIAVTWNGNYTHVTYVMSNV